MKKVLGVLLCISVVLNIVQYLEHSRIISEKVCDTTKVTIVDSVKKSFPVPVDSFVVRYIIKSLPTASDSATKQHRNDSVKVQIPISQKVYEDTLYRAYVSGYEPNLDSITIKQKTTYITRTIRDKESRFRIGLQAGYGLTPKGMQPYVGVGLSYRLTP